MKFAEDDLSQGYFITAYEEGVFKVNGRSITNSLIITPSELDENWPLSSISDLSHAHCDPIIRFEPELVIIGTGSKLTFPTPSDYAPLIDLGIAVDFMDSGAACRTYNILSGEGRKVVAGLILI